MVHVGTLLQDAVQMVIKFGSFIYQLISIVNKMLHLSTIHTQIPIQSHLLLEKQSSFGKEDATTVEVLLMKTSMETGLLTHVLLRPNLLLLALHFSSVLIRNHAM